MSLESSEHFDDLFILDARYEYEYRGGHIQTSKNVRSVAQMQLFFEHFWECRAWIVFHCEFSKNRGPTLMQHFRELDRRRNLKRYPELDFPNIFLLRGGYKQFYEECPDLCDGGYVRMLDESFERSGELSRSASLYLAGGLGDGRKGPRLHRALSAAEMHPSYDFGFVLKQLPRSPTADDLRQPMAAVHRAFERPGTS
jgi:M-phase inducer tyrosine phosphatase